MAIDLFALAASLPDLPDGQGRETFLLDFELDAAAPLTETQQQDGLAAILTCQQTLAGIVGATEEQCRARSVSVHTGPVAVTTGWDGFDPANGTD